MPELFWVHANKSNQLEVGQKVKVSLRPEVNDSFPPQGTAKSVQIDKAFEKYRKAVGLAIDQMKQSKHSPLVYVEDVTVNGSLCRVKIGEFVSQGEYRHAFEVEIDLNTNIIGKEWKRRSGDVIPAAIFTEGEPLSCHRLNRSLLTKPKQRSGCIVGGFIFVICGIS